jgi:hypothetical protein
MRISNETVMKEKTRTSSTPTNEAKQRAQEVLKAQNDKNKIEALNYLITYEIQQFHVTEAEKKITDAQIRAAATTDSDTKTWLTRKNLHDGVIADLHRVSQGRSPSKLLGSGPDLTYLRDYINSGQKQGNSKETAALHIEVQAGMKDMLKKLESLANIERMVSEIRHPELLKKQLAQEEEERKNREKDEERRKLQEEEDRQKREEEARERARLQRRRRKASVMKGDPLVLTFIQNMATKQELIITEDREVLLLSMDKDDLDEIMGLPAKIMKTKKYVGHLLLATADEHMKILESTVHIARGRR